MIKNFSEHYYNNLEQDSKNLITSEDVSNAVLESNVTIPESNTLLEIELLKGDLFEKVSKDDLENFSYILLEHIDLIKKEIETNSSDTFDQLNLSLKNLSLKSKDILTTLESKIEQQKKLIFENNLNQEKKINEFIGLVDFSNLQEFEEKFQNVSSLVNFLQGDLKETNKNLNKNTINLQTNINELKKLIEGINVSNLQEDVNLIFKNLSEIKEKTLVYDIIENNTVQLDKKINSLVKEFYNSKKDYQQNFNRLDSLIESLDIKKIEGEISLILNEVGDLKKQNEKIKYLKEAVEKINLSKVKIEVLDLSKKIRSNEQDFNLNVSNLNQKIEDLQSLQDDYNKKFLSVEKNIDFLSEYFNQNIKLVEEFQGSYNKKFSSVEKNLEQLSNTFKNLLNSQDFKQLQEKVNSLEDQVKLFNDKKEVTLKEQNDSLINKTSEEISKQVKLESKTDSYQQPNVESPSSLNEIKRKLKFLEEWLSKVSLAGPGGGAGDVINLDVPTKLVTTDYTITRKDYYVGVNCAVKANITLPDPSTIVNGREVIIKDESGRAQLNPIKVIGTVDNDPNGFEIRINNGAVQLIYRNGWRIV